MTDVMSGMDALTEPLKAKFADLTRQIEEVDTQLNVEDASKTKLLNQAAKGVETQADSLVSQVRDYINGFHGADRVGLVTALRKAIQKEFAEEVDKFVDENVSKSEAPKASEDEQAALRENRRELVKMAQSIFGLLENFGSTEGLEKPVQLRGPVGKKGKTGPRLKGSFNFSINGEVVGSKLTDVQKRVEASSVGDVRTAVEAANADFDWKMPPASFSFSINGNDVVAEQTASTNGEAASSDDEEDADSDIFDEEI